MLPFLNLVLFTLVQSQERQLERDSDNVLEQAALCMLVSVFYADITLTASATHSDFGYNWTVLVAASITLLSIFIRQKQQQRERRMQSTFARLWSSVFRGGESKFVDETSQSRAEKRLSNNLASVSRSLAPTRAEVKDLTNEQVYDLSQMLMVSERDLRGFHETFAACCSTLDGATIRDIFLISEHMGPRRGHAPARTKDRH